MIDLSKQYATRDGKYRAKIVESELAGLRPLVVILTKISDNTQYLVTYPASGKHSGDVNDSNDLVEMLPWESFKIDDKVMVSSGMGAAWHPRYFAGVGISGEPMAFDGGKTLWNAKGRISTWMECRRPTQAELDGRF